MSQQEVIKKLRACEHELREMGVRSLSLFGSVVREEAGSTSDVDLLVEFDRPVGLFRFYGVKERLQEILGVESVDLVMRRAVIEELRDSVYGEAVPCL